ncbi:MAG: Na/Pi cotransporter family protein [Tissierellaceae bacterium]|nr:Na/Pi cotransporter family protein [Tissierellaceae bacterium]
MDIAIPVIGGLGLFLYGMTMMGDGLQKAAGDRLRRLIEVLTNNRLMGVLVGALVTMVIQSSSATTVMVVGFVNAGLMSLPQAAGVIMGANIGTTITAQIIAFDVVEYAPIAVALGVAVWLSAKKKRNKDIAEIIIGIGILFIGMDMMSGGLKPLAEVQAFSDIMVNLNNPIIGVIVGLLLTTIVQSSSASIGLLQALAGEGLISINMAFPILFGDNIGTTTTSLISSVGANKTAKRAAVIHFLFNLIGTIIFMFFLRIPIQTIVEYISPGDVKRQIANAHTLFNIVNVIIQFPFAKYLVMAAEKLVTGPDKADMDATIYLDTRIIETPGIALGQAKKEVIRMGECVSKNLALGRKAFVHNEFDVIEKVYETEKLVNQIEKEITDYLVLLSSESLSGTQRTMVTNFLYTIDDIERVGDHVENLVELAEYKKKQGLSFSDDGIEGLNEMFDKCEEVFMKTMKAFETDDKDLANEVLTLEDIVDSIEKKSRADHMDRLSRMECLTEPGVLYLDALGNLERVSDHSVNIAMYVLDKYK